MQAHLGATRGTIRRSIGAARRWLPAGGTLTERQWLFRHRAILVLLWLHVLGTPFYGLSQAKGLGHSLLEALVVAVPATVASLPFVRRNLRTWAASLALLSSSAVLVHLSGGYIEMHFHFFVMVAVVALYQDWVPFLLAVGYVFVHHGLIGALDPASVYNHRAGMANPWAWAGVHAVFITGISVTCLVTWRLNERALATAEAARERLALLAEASRTMASSLDLNAMVADVARLVVPILADGCVIDLVEDDGSVRRAAAHGAGLPAPPGSEGPGPREIVAVAIDAMRGGGTTVLADRDGARQLLDRSGAASAIVAALPGRDQMFGTITLLTTDPERVLGNDDLSLVEELGRRLASAIENAKRYAHERSVAETLQRGLLPEVLPQIPGVSTAVRYRPAGEGENVGGDWYDAFVLPGGGLAAVMGDVIGRGIPAASLMGQLRNAIRAHAMDGLDPADVVEKLNRLMQGNDPQHSLATLIYAALDLADGTLRVVNAGHPPPIVLRRDGTVEFGEEGLSVPLGALPRGRFVEQPLVLSPGDTLLLYTDGLVEDRTTSLEDGLAALAGAVHEAPPDLETMCDHVLERMLQDRSLGDDIAIMAVRLLPLGESFSLELANDPRMLASLRATLRRWLEQRGASPEETFEVLVASGEACANAIEHAHGPRAETFEFEASADGGISMVVRDHGKWRSPRDTARGRGIKIMEALMDRVEVVKRLDGTEVRLYRKLASGVRS